MTSISLDLFHFSGLLPPCIFAVSVCSVCWVTWRTRRTARSKVLMASKPYHKHWMALREAQTTLSVSSFPTSRSPIYSIALSVDHSPLHDPLVNLGYLRAASGCPSVSRLISTTSLTHLIFRLQCGNSTRFPLFSSEEHVNLTCVNWGLSYNLYAISC